MYASYEYNATGGAATSSVNSIISQTTDNFSQGEIDWGVVGQASIVGGVSGAAGYAAGGWAGGFSAGLIMTGDWNEAWKMAYEGALTGRIVGAGLPLQQQRHAGFEPEAGLGDVSVVEVFGIQ